MLFNDRSVNPFKIIFKQSPFDTINGIAYDGNDARIEATIGPLGVDYSDSYFEIVTSDKDFKEWHHKVYCNTTVFKSCARDNYKSDATMIITDSESGIKIYCTIYGAFPVLILDEEDDCDNFIVRFYFKSIYRNDMNRNNTDKERLENDAKSLIHTIDTIDSLMKLNDELYSSGVLGVDEGVGKNLDDLLVDQKTACKNKCIEIFRDMLSNKH